MKLEFLLVLHFVLMYSVSGISYPKGGNKFKGRAVTKPGKMPLTSTPPPLIGTKKGRSAGGRKDNGGEGGDPASTSEGDSMPMVDESVYESMKKHICMSIPSVTSTDRKNYTLSMELTENEVFELAMTNMVHDMTSDSVLSFLPEDMRWMKQVLDLLSSITKMTCTDTVVPVEFLNVAKNLFMYYVFKNSFQESMIDPITGEEVKDEKPKQEVWDSIVDMLHNCNEQVKSLSFTMECSVASYVMTKDGSMAFIEPSEETYDTQQGDSIFGEEVIDTVWLMFSTAYARCYAMNYPLESVVLNFLENFKKEFLEPLYPRWQLLSNSYNEFFPLIMGPFNLMRAKRNLRVCTAGAYMFEEIGDRQLVRPLPLDPVGTGPGQNLKTGRSLN